jgi:peptidoglycan hydrolase-like protein with peptidoglycan-binding domain
VTEKAPARKKAVKKADTSVKPRRSALALELRHTLSSGDIGGQVKAAQDRLVKLGFTEFKNDGRYGLMMSKAVRRFQASRGLKITGDINAATWEALFTKDGA